MKKLLLISVAISFLLPVFGQDKEDYYSTEETNYYKEWSTNWKPIKKNIVKNFHSKYFELKKIQNSTPYNESLQETPYQTYIDSIRKESSSHFKGDFIGRIHKTNILKHEKKGNLEIFLYTSLKYESCIRNPGIWIAISKDFGKNWNYYYTGVVQNLPIYIKWYSNLPLITNDEKAQIECALFRQISQYKHPGQEPTFKLVKDDVCAIFNLDSICKDSDQDGLTDIVENKFHTDILNKDTDGDGIPDNLDLNPRYCSQKSEKTFIYEALINAKYDRGILKIDYKPNNDGTTYFATDSTYTMLIITDDPDLLAVQPQNIRIIFLSKKEFLKRKDPFENELSQIFISPMFKIDNMKDAFKIKFNYDIMGYTYLIKKTINGWRIIQISSWIS